MDKIKFAQTVDELKVQFEDYLIVMAGIGGQAAYMGMFNEPMILKTLALMLEAGVPPKTLHEMIDVTIEHAEKIVADKKKNSSGADINLPN